MKVYLAAPYAKRDALKKYYLGPLAELDIVCTSSWLAETHEINDGTTGPAAELDDDVASGHAEQDIVDIEDCDVLVLLTAAHFRLEPAETASGGRHVETGIALALGKHVIVVGEPENVFHRITSGAVEVVPDWTKALLALQGWQIRMLRQQLFDGRPDAWVADRRACEPCRRAESGEPA